MYKTQARFEIISISKMTLLFIILLSIVSCFQLHAQKNKHTLKTTSSQQNIKQKKTIVAKKEKTIERIKSSTYLENLINSKNYSEYVVTSEHTSSISGIHHTYVRQAINDLEVMGTESSLHSKEGSTLVAHVNFVKNISNIVKSTSASISAKQAITSVSQKMGYGTPVNLYAIEKNKNTERTAYQKRNTIYSKAGISNTDIPVKQIYYYKETAGVILAWELSIEDKNSSDWYNFIVDANTGEILTKYNFTNSCNIAGNHSNHNANIALDNNCDDEYNNESNNIKSIESTAAFVGGGSYNVYPMPVESPGHGGRSVVTDPADPTGSPYGWHDTDGVAGAESNFTIGNNCDAYDDRTSTQTGTGSGTNAERANGGAALDFNFTMDTDVTNNGGSIDAAVTNLFFWTNIIHDVWYKYGFDEAAGNFQLNNYGNGGAGNDSVRAEAQDGSGTCNANFSTPADGGRGRMQMYVCNTRDGDLDNVVVVHEYGHGLSTRLTGGAGNSGCLQNDEQMGEGWGDFIGLMMTIEPGDVGTDQRGVGTWLVGEGPNGPGIRPQPYSTTNTQSYADLGTAVVPHGVGSIWSSILWKLNWALIGAHGWDADIYNGTGGNNICLALVMEGMKLQPCSPGFVDGRDAILAADAAIYGGANTDIIWDVFANSGIGEGATQGSNNNNNTTSSTVPTPTVPRVSYSVVNGTQVEGSDCSYTDVTIPLTIGVGPSINTVATFTAGAASTATDGEDFQIITNNVTFFQGAATAQNMIVRIFHDNFIEEDETVIIDFTINSGGDANTGNTSYTLTINDDDTDPLVSGVVPIFSDDFEDGDMTNWTIDGGASATNFEVYNNASFPQAATSYFNSDQSNTTQYAGINDDLCNCDMSVERITTPVIAIGPDESHTISFDYVFDNRYIAAESLKTQFSTDNGANWTDITSLASTAGGATQTTLPWSNYTVALTNGPTDPPANYLFSILYDDAAGYGQGAIIDNFSVVGSGPLAIQTTVNTTTANTVDISSIGNVYTYDATSGNLMLNYNNINAFDYGCVDTSVEREGSNAQSYNGSTISSFVTDKAYKVIPTNIANNIDTEVTFYFTETEISGWETTTGVSRNNMFAHREGTSDIVALNVSAYGADVALTGTFTGLNGNYYFGPESAFKLRVAPKVFLLGAALNPNTGEESLMRDDLRVSGIIPITSPYADALTCDASVFTPTGANAIVDWVFIELRDETTNTIVLHSQSALLQRDGDVVAIDGVSPLSFMVVSRNYYVAIKHRNHLGVMSLNTLALSSNPITVDFTDSANQITYGTNAQSSFGMQNGMIGMWAGNVEADISVRYQGSGNDTNSLKDAILADPENTTASNLHSFTGYNIADVNLDGSSRYQGSGNDANTVKDIILSHPDNQSTPSNLFTITEQLPEN